MTTLSEEEKQRIIEEEQVRAEARKLFSGSPKHSANQPISKKQGRLLLGLVVAVVAIPLIVNYWYVLVPILSIAILWLWKKITIPRKKKLQVTAAIVALFLVINASLVIIHRPPELQILEPADNTSIQADKVLVKGKVKPASSTLTINAISVPISQGGTFETSVNLPDEQNAVRVVANNSGKEKEATLTINRIFSEEEKAQRAAEQEKREKQAQEAAKQQAEQAKKDAQKKAEEDEKKDSSIASICAKNYIKESLKAPSTAKFPWSSGNVLPLGKNKYEVRNYVDAQNGFGAMIRTTYTCTVTVVSPENFLCATSCKF